MHILNAALILGNLTSLFSDLNYVDHEVQAFIIPPNDEHKSEYVSACMDRRAFVTGFDGSAGTAVVTSSGKGWLWTDSRYWIQAAQQLDRKYWTLMKSGETGVPTVTSWLSSNKDITRVAVDAKLYSADEFKSLSAQLGKDGKTLDRLKGENIVDVVWGRFGSRPACSKARVEELNIKFSGKRAEDKLSEVRAAMSAAGSDMMVVSELDETAWLLNLRGRDVEHTPVFFSYIVVEPAKFHLFTDASKMTVSLQQRLTSIGGVIHPYGNVGDVVEQLAKDRSASKTKIWFSSAINYYLYSRAVSALQNNADRFIVKVTPIALMKAMKNQVEVKGMVAAHVRDGAAVVEYLATLEQLMANGTELTEISAAKLVEGFRSTKENFVDISFTTISASGPNAALPHYSPSPSTDRKLNVGEIYLVDSGGQYYDGTTDITRTVYFGPNPPAKMKDAFTRVLKGVIGLRNMTFPKGSVGSVLDTMARKALWEAHLDYGHGTGHGIGAFLGVHEGPFSIGGRTSSSDPGFDANMFTSDEPGYYLEGDFGIRIENIIRSVYANEDKTFLKFEDVTLAPIHLKLVDPSLLTVEEVAYLDKYHRQVRDTLLTYLKEHNSPKYVLDWLERETVPLSEYNASEAGQLISTGLLAGALILGRFMNFWM